MEFEGYTMSFFDNYKNAGTALFAVGIIQVIAGLIAIILGATDSNKNLLGCAVGGIGTILCGLVFFGLGKDIRNGNVTEKWDIVCRFVLAAATVSVIGGIFAIINSEGNIDIASCAIGIIVGLIIFWIYKQMTNNKVNTISKILWIVLLIVFVLGIIGGIMSLLVFPVGTLLGICDIIIYVFMTIAILDPAVKDKMM